MAKVGLTADATELLEVLRAAEWVMTYHNEANVYPTCPVCHADESGKQHRPGCRLDRQLRRLRANLG